MRTDLLLLGVAGHLKVAAAAAPLLSQSGVSPIVQLMRECAWLAVGRRKLCHAEFRGIIRLPARYLTE